MDLHINNMWFCHHKPITPKPIIYKTIENVKSNLVFRPQEIIKIQEDNIQKIQNILTLNFDV